MAKSLQQRLKAGGATERQAIKQALAKPGWRRYLSKSQLAGSSGGKAITQQRAMNERLAAPITQGSSTTERDLAREAHANLDLEYGPQESQLRQTLGETQQRARDTGSFYDDYIARLGQHQQNLANIGQQTSNQLVGTLAGVTGLSAANLTQLQNPAVQDAQARGATAGDLSQMASNAATTRQALLGSFAAQEAMKDQARSIYAGNQAGIVAPAQKLTAQTQAAGKVADVRKKQTELAAKRGAADVKFRSERRTEEAKNVIANAIAGVKTAGAAADVTAKKTTTAKTQADLDYFKKHGYYPSTGAPKPPKGPSASDRKTEADLAFFKKHGYYPPTGPPKPGKGDKPLTPAQRFEAAYHIKPATTEAVGRAQSTISEAKRWLEQMGPDLDASGRVLTTGQAKGKGKDEPAIPKLPAVFVRVAMDQKRLGGYISADTAARLHRAGYSVKTLGLKTKSLPGRGYTPPADARGQ